MKKRKFPFLICCEWLYQAALSVGILFVLYSFLQTELARVSVFPKMEVFLGLMTAGTFTAQLLLIWSGAKGYLFHVGLGLFAFNVTTGLFFTLQLEKSTAFWCYAGLEAACIAAASVVYVIWRSPVLKGLLILSQAASLIALAILKKPLPGACVCVMLVAFLLFLVEITARNRKEVLGVLPLFTAAMFLLCILPQNEKPLDWNWVKDTYTVVQEKAKMQMVNIAYLFQGENKFSFSFTGYGSEGGLGGFLFNREQAQLHVTGSGTKNPLYLTGMVYEVYTGKDWQSAPMETGKTGPKLQQDCMLNALRNSIYAKQQDDFTASCLISVTYGFIKTTDFFHELHTTNLYGGIPPFKEDTLWTMKDAQGKDFAYQLRFLEINEQSDEIKALLRQRAWKEDVVWDSASCQREDEIYKTYTELPDDIPQRVYELAHTIAADADNDYDRMTAFAEYLKNYTYTKTPTMCPDGQDFIDYFLFDSKSGYCTYFATAMAVLGRCEGIPTRYVKGFMTADTCTNSPMDVMITGEQAHAWTEVYIEHVGWVRFDATPGYGEGYTNRWKHIESVGIGQTENPYSHVVASQEKPTRDFESQEEPVRQGKSAQWYVLVLLKIIVALLAECTLGVVIVWFRNAVRRKKYAGADTQEKMRLQIKRLLRLGKLQGVTLLEGETLQAYQERAHEILDTKEYSFARACTLYERMRFGGRTVSLAELRQMEAYVEKTEQCYLAGSGFLKKLIYRVM